MVLFLQEPDFDRLLLLRFAAEVVARRNLDDLVHAGVVVHQAFLLLDLLEVLVEAAGVEGKVNGGLVVHPVGVEVFELGEYLLHLFLEYFDVLVEEFLDAVAAEVEEHGDLLELAGAGRLIHMNNIWKHVEQI